VLIGSLANASAVGTVAARLARERGSGITVISAGRNLLPAVEDDYSASEIILAMGAVQLHPAVELLEPADPVALFHESDSGTNLVERGADADVTFCAQRDVLTTVPILRDGVLVNWETVG
jgi:phosphosulfolactate phosphohydrolase-like enzyme